MAGMKASEYKEFKGIRKKSLRDNMIDIEVILTELGEVTTRDIVRKEKVKGLKENIKVTKRGGNASKVAKDYYEKETGIKAVTSENAIGGRYSDIKKIEN